MSLTQKQDLLARAIAIGKARRDLADMTAEDLRQAVRDQLGPWPKGLGDIDRAAGDEAFHAAMYDDSGNFSAFGRAEHDRVTAALKAREERERQREVEEAENRKKWAKDRLRIFARLRKMGFKRDTTTDGSAYYRHPCGLVVRVSDHEVPLTEEREWNLLNGRRSWADSRYSFVCGGDLDGWFEEVHQRLIAPPTLPATTVDDWRANTG